MGGGTAFVRLLCDGPMSFAICGVSPYCHANGARSFGSSLYKTRGVTFLWRYGACLSSTEGHQPVMDPWFPSIPFPPINCCPSNAVVFKHFIEGWEVHATDPKALRSACPGECPTCNDVCTQGIRMIRVCSDQFAERLLYDKL